MLPWLTVQYLDSMQEAEPHARATLWRAALLIPLDKYRISCYNIITLWAGDPRNDKPSMVSIDTVVVPIRYLYATLYALVNCCDNLVNTKMQ